MDQQDTLILSSPLEPTQEKVQSYGRQLFTLILSVAIVMTGFGIIFPIFPQLLFTVGGGDAEDLGAMAAAFGLSYLIASPIFGNLADTFGKKRVILIGLLGFSTSNLVYVYASEIWHFYLARAVEGAFSSAILPPAIALTTQLTPKNVRAKYIGYVVAGNTIGLIIGPLLGGVLFDGIIIGNTILIEGSLFLPFWVSFGVGLFAFVFALFFLPSTKDYEKEKAKRMKHDRVANGESEIVEKTFGSPQREKGLLGLLKHQINVLPRPRHMFLIFAIAETLTILPWLVVSPGFIFYFYEELLLSASDFGYFVAAYGLFAASGQAILGNLSDTKGRKPIILAGQFFGILFYAFLPVGRVVWQFMLIASLAGIASGLRDPALKAMLSDVTEENTRATVFGLESGFISSSQIIGPLLGGFLYIRYGIELVFLVSLSIAIINVFFIGIIKFLPLDQEATLSNSTSFLEYVNPNDVNRAMKLLARRK